MTAHLTPDHVRADDIERTLSLPLPENPPLELVEDAALLVLRGLVQLEDLVSYEGMTDENRRDVRRCAEGLLYFTAADMPVRPG